MPMTKPSDSYGKGYNSTRMFQNHLICAQWKWNGCNNHLKFYNAPIIFAFLLKFLVYGGQGNENLL